MNFLNPFSSCAFAGVAVNIKMAANVVIKPTFLINIPNSRSREGFKDTPESVRKTVETIKTHPLVPKDIVVRGFIIDSETGALEEIMN